jgi:DNA-binding HxlR family transcriptional regulator
MDPAKKPSLHCCPLAHALTVTGDAWSMLILRDVGSGLLRYDQLRESLGIAPNILSARLRALVEAGLLAKRRYSERPPRDEYVLTQAGRDFVPILHAIGAWARRQGDAAGYSRLVDAATGAPIDPVVAITGVRRCRSSFPMPPPRSRGCCTTA